MTVLCSNKFPRTPVRQIEVRRICFNECIGLYLLALHQKGSSLVPRLILAQCVTIMGEYSWQEVSSVPSLVSYFLGSFLPFKVCILFGRNFLKLVTPLTLLSHCPQLCTPQFKNSRLQLFTVLKKKAHVMGRLFDGPTESLRALTPPTRVVLVCSFSHHITQDTIP